MDPSDTNPDEPNGTANEMTAVRQATLSPLVLCCDGGIPVDGDGTLSEDTADQAGDDSSSLPSLTPSVRAYIRADRGGGCELCDAGGQDANLHIHHRTPKSDGGTNHPENLILLCQACHERHHGNEPINPPDRNAATTKQGASEVDAHADGQETAHTQDPANSDETDASADASTDDSAPLPPRSEPNGADKEILSLIENEGALSTGELAASTDYSTEYIRRQCWKLAGEQLIAPRTDNKWDLAVRTDTDKLQIGLPDRPKAAARAGRDEMIRKMSAHGISHTEIADIANLSRSTIDIAVYRARALRLDLNNPDNVDVATIASRLSALVELIDHAQIE